MAGIAALTRRINDMEKEFEALLVEAENLMAPEEREEFAKQVELIFLKSNVELIDMCSSKMANLSGTYYPGEVNKKWRELRAKSEILRRRNELLSYSTPEEFQATLMWMAEQGTQEDLSLLRRVRTSLPDRSADVNRLFEIAEQRINQRTTGFHE